MMKRWMMKRFSICFIIVGLMLIVADNAISGPCMMPTAPKEVEYPDGWFGGIEIYTSSEEVEPGGTVDVWAVSSGGLPCVPYRWSVSGNGFELGSDSTWGDYEKNMLYAGDNACGTAEVEVMDARGVRATGYVRSTNGRWVWISDYNPVVDGCYVKGSPDQTYYVPTTRGQYWIAEKIEGKYKLYEVYTVLAGSSCAGVGCGSIDCDEYYLEYCYPHVDKCAQETSQAHIDCLGIFEGYEMKEIGWCKAEVGESSWSATCLCLMKNPPLMDDNETGYYLYEWRCRP
jgi:hypothetical protein